MSDIGYDIWAGIESGNAMTEQADNELICEKLLGWRKVLGSVWPNQAVWTEQLTPNTGRGGMETPAFTTWAEAGLILDALKVREPHTHDLPIVSLTSPLAIRAVALAYLKAQS